MRKIRKIKVSDEPVRKQKFQLSSFTWLKYHENVPATTTAVCT